MTRNRTRGQVPINASLLRSELAREWRWIAVAAACAATAVAGQVLQGPVARDLIDVALPARSDRTTGLVAQLALWSLTMSLSIQALQFVLARIKWSIEMRVRRRVHLVIVESDPAELTGPSGQLVSRLLGDLGAFQRIVDLLPTIAFAIPAIGGFVYVAYVDVRMALIIFLPAVVNAFVAQRARVRLAPLSWQAQQCRGELTRTIDEAIRGIRIVKICRREAAENERVDRTARHAFVAEVSRARAVARVTVLALCSPVAMVAAVMWVGGLLLLDGSITPGDFPVFVVAATQLFYLSEAFASMADSFADASSGATRIGELLAERDEAATAPGEVTPWHPAAEPGEPAVASAAVAPAQGEAAASAAVAPRRLAAGLVADALMIRSDATASDLAVDLHAEPGSLTVLTGATTGELSALGGVLCGLDAPSAGRLRLDGHDVHAATAGRRPAIRLLTATPFLFARRIRANLLLGRYRPSIRTPRSRRGAVAVGDTDTGVDTDAATSRESEQRCRAALEAAGLLEVIDQLPHGLDEMLADRGGNLSGGQRQRLALARALVDPPRVLILDEALSGVHPSLQSEILDRVVQFAPDTAVVLLAQTPPETTTETRIIRVRSVPRLRLTEPTHAITAMLPAADLTLPPATANSAASASDTDSAVAASDTDSALAASAGTTAPSHPAAAAASASGSGSGPIAPFEVDLLAASADTAPTIGRLVRTHRGRLAVVALGATALSFAALLPTALFGRLTDAASAYLDLNGAHSDAPGRWEVFRFAPLWLAVGVTMIAVRYLTDVGNARISASVMYGLRRRLFGRLSRLGLSYFDNDPPGEIATRVNHDLGVVAGLATDVTRALLSASTTMLVALGFMISLSPRHVGAFLAIAGAVAITVTVQSRLLRRAYDRFRDELGTVVTQLEEDYNGRFEIAALGAGTGVHHAFLDATARLRNAERRVQMIATGFTSLSLAIVDIGGGLVLLSLVGDVRAGVLAIGAMVSVRLYLTQALAPIQTIGGLWQQVQRARVALDRLGRPFAAEIDPRESPTPREVTTSNVESSPLTLGAVGFRYEGRDAAALADVTLDIPAGQMIAVVGPTGAGKSTLARVVGRIVDPTTGSVWLGEYSLRDLSLDSTRRLIGLVQQEPFLFAGTIRSNLTYGRPSLDSAAIEHGLLELGLLEQIAALPNGLDTPVAEEGGNLSATTRQAVALARIWLCRPDVLLLDEATALLDDAVERAVLHAIRASDRTTVVITHRRRVAEAADRIVVIDGGRVSADLVANDARTSEILDRLFERPELAGDRV